MALDAIAFTPHFDVVTQHLLGAPPEIVERVRMSLAMMLPWIWTMRTAARHVTSPGCALRQV